MADNLQTFPKTEAKPLLESMTIQITLFQTYVTVTVRCISGKLWYLQHNCVGDTIVYH